jgi:3-methylfumaryl-CoA hydratase
VTVKTDIASPRGVAITEEQDIVYREEPDPNAAPAPPQRAPGTAVWKKAVTPDVVMLFRYSALTFNGHRIHYDHPYVTGVEGYPALVMNGGLTTLLVHELVREHAPKPLRYIASRNVRPLFADRQFMVCGEPSSDGSKVKLWVVDDSEALALSAEAELAA